jgi:hypothetical protein
VMRIIYRRMSGAIGLTDEEKGTRGLWLEKRRALLRELKNRGHEVILANRFTAATEPHPWPYTQYVVPEMGPMGALGDVLMVEFGSSNTRFYGEDLDKTLRLIRVHEGKPCIFLCDDPDLAMVWKWVRRPQDWVCWYNATRGQPFGGQPASVRIDDAPFASLLKEPAGASAGETGRLVYVGRAKGREAIFRDLLQTVPIEIAGREKEWTDFPGANVIPMPDQCARSDFYAARRASLVIADRKHKKMGWRTGRAYHALYAGTPAIVEPDHDGLGKTFQVFYGAKDLAEIMGAWGIDKVRRAAWQAQMNMARLDAEIMSETMSRAGL